MGHYTHMKTFGFTTHSNALSSIFAGTRVAQTFESSTLAAKAVDREGSILAKSEQQIQQRSCS